MATSITTNGGKNNLKNNFNREYLQDQLLPEQKNHLQNQQVSERSQSVATKGRKPIHEVNPLKVTKKVFMSIPRSAEETEMEYANKVLDYFLFENKLTRSEL